MSWTWDREKEGDYWELCATPYMSIKESLIIGLHPRYYFKQLNYIKGTYIRKDKFRENINRKVEYIDPLITIDLNILPDLNSKEWIDKWKSLIREVGFMMIKTSGIPQKYMGNE